MIVPGNLDDAPKLTRGRHPPSAKRSMANDADDEGEVSLCRLIAIHTSDIAMQDAPNPKRGRPPPLEGEVSSSLSIVVNASDTHVAHRPTVRAVREERLALCHRHQRHYQQGPLALSYLQHHEASVSA